MYDMEMACDMRWLSFFRVFININNIDIQWEYIVYSTKKSPLKVVHL